MKLIKLSSNHYIIVDELKKDTYTVPLSEVKELLGEVDVEKKAEEMFPIYDGDLLGIAYNQKNSRIDFILGYNQALEDNKDKVYTEEDMKKAFSRYAFASTSNQPYSEDELLNQFRKFIQSLQPPTSWDVEIVNGKIKLV